MPSQPIERRPGNAGGYSTHRLASVDGVRGLAIAMVIFGHLIGFAGLLDKSALYSFLFQTPLHVLWDETGAVQMFFVLSGFVLQLGLQVELSPPAVWQFIVVRSFRLYPLYAIGLLFALITRLAWAGHANLLAFNDNLAMFWNQPIQWPELISHLSVRPKTSRVIGIN